VSLTDAELLQRLFPQRPARHTADTSSLEYHLKADGVGADLLSMLLDLVSGYPSNGGIPCVRFPYLITLIALILSAPFHK
jgi:hypothetical protein